MKTGYTHISILLDKSGSMQSCESLTREGFNSFIHQQKSVPGEVTVSLIQFDDRYEVNYSFLPLANVPQLTVKNYQPRGSTALLDAIARSIKETGEQLAEMREELRPARVLFVIQTDGYENASRNFTRQQVCDAVKHQQEKYSWDFIFLGANQDAVLVGESLGIHGKSALSYEVDNADVAFAVVGNYAARYRNASTDDAAKLCSFSTSDRSSSVNTEAAKKCCKKKPQPAV